MRNGDFTLKRRIDLTTQGRNDLGPALSQVADGIRISIKVVPGARKEKLVGMLGDRLKLSVRSPPEGGKANKAVQKLLAGVLNLPPRDVQIVDGSTQPRKTVEVSGISLCQCAELLLKNIRE